MYCLEKLQRELAYFFDMDLRELPRVQDLLKQKGYTQIQKGDEIIKLEPIAQAESTLSAKTTSKLTKDELDNLPIATPQEYGEFLEKIAQKDYQNTPEILKIATLNNDLQELINNNHSANVFITRARAGHISEARKGEYDQALTLDEQKQIPAVIAQAKEAYTDEKSGFILPFADKNNNEKINLIILDSDSKGNFLITAKKVNSAELNNPKYKKLARAGVEPATTTPPKAEQKPTEAISPARDEIIPQTQMTKDNSDPVKTFEYFRDDLIKEYPKALESTPKDTPTPPTQKGLFDEVDSSLSQEIKDIIDSSPAKGRDMQIIGEANFTAQVVEYAHKNNKKVAIDKLSQAEAEQLGFKHPSDVRVTIDYQAINHTLNRHGADSPLVQQSGQKAVDYTDIAEYRSIVKSADESLNSVDNLGQEVIVSFKQINGHAVVVESIRKKGNELAFKSMHFENGSYKNSNAYKNAVDSQKANPSPAPYGYEPHADANTPPLKTDTEIIPQTEISNIKKQLVELKESKSAYQKVLKSLERNMKDVELEERRYLRGEESIKVFERKRLIQSSIDEHTQGLNAVLKKMIELHKQLPENVRYTKEVLDDLTKIEAILKGNDYSLEQALRLSKITQRLQEKAIIESESFLNKVYNLDDFAKGAKSLQGTNYAYNTDESIKRYFKTIAEMIDSIPAFKKISANPETPPKADSSTPSFTYTTGEAKGIAELRKDLKQALEPYKSTPITNKETGLQGVVTTDEINKIASKKAVDKSVANGFTRDEHFTAAQDLKNLFENSKLKESHADNKHRENIKVHRFIKDLHINDKPAQAKITLFEKIEGKNRIYTLELESLNKPDSLGASVHNTESAAKAQSVATAHPETTTIAKTDGESIAQDSNALLESTMKSFKYDERKAKDLLEWHSARRI